jgi:hypothetical protein
VRREVAVRHEKLVGLFFLIAVVFGTDLAVDDAPVVVGVVKEDENFPRDAGEEEEKREI